MLSVGAQTSGTWTIGEVQLEAGQVATPFERRPNGLELALCQRYFFSTYGIGVAPGKNMGAGANTVQFGVNTSSSGANVSVMFGAPMRVAPTVVVYDYTGTAYKGSYFSGTWISGAAINGAVFTTVGGFVNILGANGQTWAFDMTASAEL